MYTRAREAGTVGGRPYYDAAGLYTGLREAGTIGPPAAPPYVDPTGMYTALREAAADRLSAWGSGVGTEAGPSISLGVPHPWRRTTE